MPLIYSIWTKHSDVLLIKINVIKYNEMQYDTFILFLHKHLFCTVHDVNIFHFVW